MSETGDPHGNESSKASPPQATTSSHGDEKIAVQHSCGPTPMTTQSAVTPSRTKRRRQRSPESAISPASRRPRKRMRPALGHPHGLGEGREGQNDPSRGRAESPDPSDGSSEFEDDDEEEDEDESREVASQPSQRTGISSTPTNISQPGQKPKRTRQLTTPHQSAVLHALLAQSRFPTTQMREEVGRQIGLSARKVQVWFQNQRQKAKKNNKEAEEAAAAAQAQGSTGRFAQYQTASSRGAHIPAIAPGPPVPQLVSDRPSNVVRTIRPPYSDSGPTQRPVLTGPPPPHPHHLGLSGPVLHPTQRPFERLPSSRLTGPGVPGTGPGINPYEPSPRGIRPSSPPLPSAAYHRPMSPGISYSPREPVPGRAERAHQAHPIQLPPLRIDTRDSGQRGEPIVTSPSSLRTTESPVLPIPRHYSSATRHPADQSPHSPANYRLPRTLEPNPLWSSQQAPHGPPSTLGSPPGHSAYWGSSARHSTDAESARTDRSSTTLQPLSRFDPVRNRSTSDSPHASKSRRSYSHSPEDV